jgi:hypothetical protein
MENGLRAIFDIVIWVLVPVILFIILRRAHRMSKQFDDERHKAAAKSGFWAGTSLFLIILVYQVSIFIKSGFPNLDIYAGFDIWLALIGAAVGFVLSYGGRRTIPPKLVGFSVLVVTFLASYSLFHYLFIRTYNEVVLSLVLGITFGLLVHYASGSGPSFRETKKPFAHR